MVLCYRLLGRGKVTLRVAVADLGFLVRGGGRIKQRVQKGVYGGAL